MDQLKVVRENWIKTVASQGIDGAAMMKDFDAAAAAKYNTQFPDKWPANFEKLYNVALK